MRYVYDTMSRLRQLVLIPIVRFLSATFDHDPCQRFVVVSYNAVEFVSNETNTMNVDDYGGLQSYSKGYFTLYIPTTFLIITPSIPALALITRSHFVDLR